MNTTLLLSLMLPKALAGSAGTEELLSEIERVPPTVIFIVDMSAAMESACDGGSGDSCLQDVADAIDAITRHFDWANYGVVGTTASASDDSYFQIVPVGSSYGELSDGLSDMVTNWSSTHGSSVTTRNLGEVIFALADTYLDQTDYDNESDDDGDNFTGDWAESPVEYSCSETYIITLTAGEPIDDDQVNDGTGGVWSRAPVANDVKCDENGDISSSDFWCAYDNVVYHGWSGADLQSGISDTQSLIVHTIGLGLDSGSLAEDLYQNASDGTGGAASYTNAETGDDILGAIVDVLAEIQAGTYSRSSPVITADGAYMIYTFYEITGSNPLPEGHIRAYALDNDPASSTYGQVLYEGSSEYGGAIWDGGDLLVSRLVLASESNPGDNDGVGQRDIYFFDDIAYTYMATMKDEAQNTMAMGFDADFVSDVNSYASTTLSYYLDDTVDAANSPCAANEAYDLDGDCIVNADDMQTLVDFVRGLPEAEFRYLDMERGRWKLADSPYAVPVVVTARNDVYSTDLSYQRFIDRLDADGVPSVVIVPANDGMLHAFRLEDDPLTASEDEAGEELWAWVPSSIIRRSRNEEWTSGLLDLMWYGKTFLFDGSPAVEDVWIDENGDGVKADCVVEDDCEWHRVLVVQQGMGGPVTLALDITHTQYPKFLWEQNNTTDQTAMGYTMGQPVIANFLDSDEGDRWVALWGGGRAAPYTGVSNAYYKSAEPNLYIWAVEDATNLDYADYIDVNENGQYDLDQDSTNNYSVAGSNISSKHPEILSGALSASSLAYDSDSNVEYGYVSAALAAVDYDQDGDVDVAYFPVTTSYKPTDMGGSVSDVEDPGASWMYKAIFDAGDVDAPTWCLFYDPKEGTDGTNGVGVRPEVFYAATTAWTEGGELAIYWGTGTPFDRTGTSTGYLFAMVDPDPLSCSTPEPITCDGNPGYYELPYDGEGLTSSPIVYAGVVYFTTYAPNEDQCEIGKGRLYGLYFDDCSGAIDDDGDGEGDLVSTDPMEGYVSQPTVTDMGTIIYGSANPSVDGSDAIVETINAVGSGMLGTRTMAWMELM
jgi:hypothetical protein